MSERIIGTRIESHDKGSDIAISVSHLSKSFRLPTERSWGLKQAIFNRLRGIKGYRDQQVLSDISFDIKKGEFVGIVGRNGSGKSTLLKILAGVYYPSSGQVVVNGNLIPFIELGVGFNMELTGRENVYLNGAMLGFSNSEITAMYDDIVKFAELEDFMDQKLKNYSSGMQVRLAFSIAIRAKGDILILDEVLAVGDAAFQKNVTIILPLSMANKPSSSSLTPWKTSFSSVTAPLCSSRERSLFPAPPKKSPKPTPSFSSSNPNHGK